MRTIGIVHNFRFVSVFNVRHANIFAEFEARKFEKLTLNFEPLNILKNHRRQRMPALGRRKYDDGDDTGYDANSGPRNYGKRVRPNNAEPSISPAEQLEGAIIRFTGQVRFVFKNLPYYGFAGTSHHSRHSR
jgi:hypothetical protein